jgi:LPXTG-site transpeptidase (sortase) family protein
MIPIVSHSYSFIERSVTNKELIKDYPGNKDNNYLAILEIPKIKLKRGFYNIDSKDNNVKKNIQVLKFGINNIILAAHSGNSSNAYFKDLYKLELSDLVNIYYQDIIINYKIVNIFSVDKKGYIDIDNKYLNDTLILITCNQKDKTKQIVIICERLK